MELFKLGKRAFDLVRTSRALWLFGVFAGTGAGSGATGGGGDKPGTTLAGHAMPSWLIPLLIAGAVIALAALLMHLVSEGALILGVRKRLDGERFGVGRGFSEGRRFVGRVLALELTAGAAFLTLCAVVAGPVLLHLAGLIPLVPALLAAVPLLLVAVPALLSVYMLRQWALRAAVLDDRPFAQAIAAARGELRGRLLDSLQLMLLEVLGQFGGAIAGFMVAIPAALVGLVVGLLFGLIPGIVVGVTLGAPFLLAAVGASNAFRSAVWTLGFLDGKNGSAAA